MTCNLWMAISIGELCVDDASEAFETPLPVEKFEPIELKLDTLEAGDRPLELCCWCLERSGKSFLRTREAGDSASSGVSATDSGGERKYDVAGGAASRVFCGLRR